MAVDEHFLVWMRTAGLPTFRKLWARNDQEDFVAGVYEIDIFLSTSYPPLPSSPSLSSFSVLFSKIETDLRIRTTDYPVAPFSGTKSLVFSTVSFIGGRNPFLGIAYIAAGGICVVLGLLLTARHLIRPRRLGDMAYLRLVLL